MENKRTILLTGASGFLGSRILSKINKNNTVYLLSNKSRASKSNPNHTHITINELDNFYQYCKKDLCLNIIGLMCLPPINSNTDEYFNILRQSAEKLNLTELSMGMSSDYEKAALNGSTFLRLGTVILGQRKSI